MLPKYPVYVISKGRFKNCSKQRKFTAARLLLSKTPFHIVVEPQEANAYAAEVGIEHVLVLPFSNLGLGSIPARNWVWEHSIAAGHARHWILDDNLQGFRRRWKTLRVPCNASTALHVIEEFTDRYENIAIAGPNYTMFAPDSSSAPPFILNAHVYSCLLIQNSLTQRWRGRYNEDTDLCLQVLSTGKLCTVQFNAILVDKLTTMKMSGGNTDSLYSGDGRLKMSRSLERAWPGVVETRRRFNRPQHHIKNSWQHFDTPLIRRADIDWAAMPTNNEFGMTLNQVRAPRKGRSSTWHK